MKRKSSPISVRSGKIEFLKFNTARWEWRDAYHTILSLSWSRFIAFILGIYSGLIAIFALLYAVGGNAIAEMRSGSVIDAFFFSVETLATVGYGHMYPATTYGHAVVTIEIITGTFWLAILTGLVFVRFSRPTARIEFSRALVIGTFDGEPALMLRVANLRHTTMVEAEFRIMFMRDEVVAEGDTFRRFYPLKLQFDRLILFPAAVTLRHIIDEKSPLYGVTPESLQACDARFVASVICIETIVSASVQSQQDYGWRDVRFGERFVEIYNTLEDGRQTVDYGKLHDTEPVPKNTAGAAPGANVA